MIKLIGSILIVFTGAGIGFSKAEKLEEQLGSVRLVIHMLNDVKVMLESAYLTTEEIADRLEQNSEYKKSGLFDNLPDGSEKILSVVRNIDRSDFIRNEKDKERLKRFFGELGTTDISGQLSKAELCISEFKNAEEVYKEKVSRYARLYRGLGILSGAMTAVILL